MNENFKTLHSRDRPAYLYTSTPTPREEWLQAPAMAYTILSQGTLAGVVVVVVVEATRASITKPHDQASPQEGVEVRYKLQTKQTTARESPHAQRARAVACLPLATQVGASLLKLGLV